MSKSIVTIALLINVLLLSQLGYGQVGGQRTFEFVNVPANPRLTALGGVNVTQADEDVNMLFSNPALMGDTLSGRLGINFLSYFADTKVMSFAYQHDLGKYGHWFIGAVRFDYGSFSGRDASGNLTQEFDAAESMLVIGRTHKVGNFRLGGSIKYINSTIENYVANGLVFDIGGVFQHPEKALNVGLVMKNVGVIINNYTTSDADALPFDVQLGTTFKPAHMPFRFSFTAYNLYQGDIAYFNERDPFLIDEPGTGDKIFRHLTIGAELLLSKNVNIRAGYNHLVRQELKLQDTAGGAGFSYGFMFRIKAFEFSYSRGGYHAAGGAHNFGIVANTNTFFSN